MPEGHLERQTGTKLPFKRDEGHLSEAHYFDELVEEGGVPIPKPRGAPLPARADLDGNKPDPDNSAHNSICHPDRPNRISQTKRRELANKTILLKKFA